MVGDRADFFVSHAGADRAWAEWVAWQLTGAGYTVELDVWDWAAGQNFITAMSDALGRCDRVVALFSAAYFDRSRYTTEEWATALLHVPGTGDHRLVPVRVEEVPLEQMPAVLRPLVFRDLFGAGEEQARQILLEAVAGPKRPDRKPVFPGHGTPRGLNRLGSPGPRLPGNAPRMWNIPTRNPAFTGRDSLLVEVRERLLADDRAVVQALQGMGGVGKTQLAAEYAHQFAGTYDLAWWVNSQQAGLIGDQFAAMGTALGCVDPGASMEVVRAAVLAELRQRGQWLLVFDNAENPADIRPWLPGGGGHVLITSRERVWAEVAVPVEVDVMARPESVAMLRGRVPELSETDAYTLAGQLGDLPLAVAQAAGFMAETGMPAAQYLGLLRTRAGQLLDQGAPGSYPRSLAAATRAADPLAWRQTLAHLARQALARVDQGGLQVHRLTQAILRDLLTPALAATARERTEAILAASDPGESGNPATWPRWARLIPHLLAANLAASGNPDLGWVACEACLYLLRRGDTRAGHDLARDLRQQWRRRLGADDQHTRAVAHYLASALRDMGRYADARDLDQDTLDRSRRLLGADHRQTLSSANSLAIDLSALGEVQAARELDQDTLERRRRVLGEDHPSALSSASNLANDLRALGEVEAARELDQDTLERRRRVLGEDHPDTVQSASNLAADLRALGEADDES